MPPSWSDRQLLLFTTIVVIVAGLLVASALVIATGGEPSAADARRQPVFIGNEKELRLNIRQASPLYLAHPFGGNGFWLDLEDGELIAIKLIEPGSNGCPVKWKETVHSYVDCHGTPVARDSLDRYQLDVIKTGPRKGSVLVDRRTTIPAPAG